MPRSRSILAALALLVLAGAAYAADIPYLSGRVTDNAEILNAETRRDLTALLAEHERATTNQVAVLTVKTLAGESIEDYANAVFRAWQLGRKDKNNGVLLVIAPQERRLRIEVGYGLEGTLTDLIAGRIIQNVITPRFKRNSTAVRDGVGAVRRDTAVISDETPSTGTASVRQSSIFGSAPARA